MSKDQRFFHFWLSAVPHMISLLNLLSGFFALVAASQGKMAQSGWLIVIALLWDSLDGSIARVLNVTSDFGRELDSLADMVSFVVAPAFFIFRFWNAYFQEWPLVIIFCYVVAGAYRLARFNISPKVKNYFRGLPVPAAAVAMVMTSLAFQKHAWMTSPLELWALMLLMSFLMVSQIPYPKLSVLRFNRWHILFHMGLGLFPAALFFWGIETALSGLFLWFLVFGPVQCAYLLRQEKEEFVSNDHA